VPYSDLVYQPMIELLDYLRANEFKTFIVSGGGVDFMRVFTEEVYGIPPEQIIGSMGDTEFEIRDGVPVLVKQPGINFVDDKEGKPVGIARFIGRRPILAFGNSDGDLQMLQYTAGGGGASFMGYVHHDDACRRARSRVQRRSGAPLSEPRAQANPGWGFRAARRSRRAFIRSPTSCCHIVRAGTSSMITKVANSTPIPRLTAIGTRN